MFIRCCRVFLVFWLGNVKSKAKVQLNDTKFQLNLWHKNDSERQLQSKPHIICNNIWLHHLKSKLWHTGR